MKSKIFKCKVCDSEFKSQLSLSKHIKIHGMNSKEYFDMFFKIDDIGCCKICNKPTKFVNGVVGYKLFCSHKCAGQSEEVKEKRKNNLISKHGSITNAYSGRVEKSKITSLERYGTNHYSKTTEYKEKSKQTKMKLYNDENYNNKEKSKQTNLERYGVEHTWQVDIVKNKIKQTNLERYGSENPFGSDIVKNKIKQTNLERYGSENPMQSEKLKNRALITKRINYYDEFLNSLKNKKIVFMDSKDDYLDLKSHYNFNCERCNKEFVYEVFNNQLNYNVVSCTNHKNVSVGEDLLAEEISKIYKGTIIRNKRWNIEDRKYELDIFIPEFNLGIEYNGTYWHSDKFSSKLDHQNKKLKFKSVGIDLIHVFSNEINNNPDVIMSIIKNRMKIVKKRIYARKTIKKEISTTVYKDFLIENHMQGFVGAKIKLGLFFENELISVVGIGQNRFEDGLELIRYSVKSGISIIGGLSKLLKDFNEITSYCDYNLFNGKGYEAVGFKKIKLTSPGYVYIKGNSVLSRYQCQKHKLEKLLKKFDPLLSENENMNLNNFYKVYNSGNIKFKRSLK